MRIVQEGLDLIVKSFRRVSGIVMLKRGWFLVSVLITACIAICDAQNSYEHLSQRVEAYPFGGSVQQKQAVLNAFLRQSSRALVFDFSEHPDQEYLLEKEFTGLFTQMREQLQKPQQEVKTLLFENASGVWIQRMLDQSGLSPKTYQHTAGKPWPSTHELLEMGKPLVLLFFNTEQDTHLVEGNYVHDLGAFQLSKKITQADQLLLLKVSPPAGSEVELAPQFVDAFIHTWRETGQVPNFIWLDHISFPQPIDQIINSTEKLVGNVGFPSSVSYEIYWEGDFTATTGHDFCFPVYAGESFSLTPQLPGFFFTPAALTYTEGAGNRVKIRAEANEITDRATAYYPLDGDLDDALDNKLHGEFKGIRFVEDFNRGNVAVFEGKHQGLLPAIKELGLPNNSFTISTWVRFDSVSDSDQVIFSSTINKYSEGLHILVREKKPYFAFYHNDLEGNTELEPNRWYHIVWRYHKTTQQQAIFIDGKLDAMAFGRPPLKGAGGLYIGYRKGLKGNNQDTFLAGSLDDVIFWDRPLGDNEIAGLYTRTPDFSKKYSLWVWLVPLGMLVLAFSVFSLLKTKKKERREQGADPVVSGTPDRNAIFMFGGLKVIDKEGNNITNEITPRLKELFLLLLLSTHKTKKGISSEDLSHSIWPGLPRDKAINNRGVSTTKLRQVLTKLDGVSVDYHNQFWTIGMGPHVYCDYAHFLELTQEKAADTQLDVLSQILKNGDFLPNLSKEWLDPYKFEVSNKVIDIYAPALEHQWKSEQLDRLIDYCDIVLTFDVVHETAIKYKVAALKKQKKHEQALKVYQGFTTLYQQFYKEEFVVSFQDFHP